MMIRKNRVMTQEHKDKIRAAALARQAIGGPGCFMKGVSSWNKARAYQIGQGRYKRTESHISLLREKAFPKGHTPWNKDKRGPNSHAWKGGKSTLTSLIREHSAYKEWRANVYRRDGWTCQTCGLRGHGKDIEAHHIIELRVIIQEIQSLDIATHLKFEKALKLPFLFDISNGVTLCKDCHIFTYKGNKK